MIYEYRCIQCGNVFEMSRSAEASSLPGECPACGSTADRLPSVNVAVHYKGNGFYSTDYKKKENGRPKS